MRTKYIILTVLSSLSLASCNYLDFDETNGLKTKEDMYKYFGTSKDMLSHVYSYMPDMRISQLKESFPKRVIPCVTVPQTTVSSELTPPTSKTRTTAIGHPSKRMMTLGRSIVASVPPIVFLQRLHKWTSRVMNTTDNIRIG